MSKMDRDRTDRQLNAAPKLSRRTRFRNWRADNLWIAIGLAAGAAFFLGVTGFRKFFEQARENRSLYDLVYLTLQLFTLNSGGLAGPKQWELEAARFLAPAVATFAAIKALTILFRDKFQMWRLRTMKGHVVICGLGRKGRQLADDFIGRGKQVVIVESNDDNDEIDNCRERGAIVLVGSATSEFILRKARVQHAEYLFVVCSEDSINLDATLLAHQVMLREEPGAIARLRKWCCVGAYERLSGAGGTRKLSSVPRCFVHVVDTQLRELLARHKVFTKIQGPYEIKSFNIYENAARQLFRDHPPDLASREKGGPGVHLLIVGFGQMGRSVALEAAKVGHYIDGERVRITVVDRAAKKRGGIFLHKYPKFDDICDISFIGSNTDDIEFLNGSFLAGRGGKASVTQAIVCLEDEAAGLVCALNLMGLFKDSECKILVRINVETRLVDLLQGRNLTPAEDGELRRTIHAFGSISETCSSRMVLKQEMDRMARKVHEGYLRHRLNRGDDPSRDQSLRNWEELPEDLKESNRQQTEHMDVKLRAVGRRRRPISESNRPPATFTPEEIELLAKMEHSRWNAERFLDGWVRGPKKDLEAKTNPFLVDWDELPENIKDYDRDFVRDIPAILQETGEEIERIA